MYSGRKGVKGSLGESWKAVSDRVRKTSKGKVKGGQSWVSAEKPEPLGTQVCTRQQLYLMKYLPPPQPSAAISH